MAVTPWSVRAMPLGWENGPPVQSDWPLMVVPKRRSSPVAENPLRQNIPSSTVSLSTLSADPLGLENWPPVQPNWPLMWAPGRRTSPLAENPSRQNISPSTARPSALRADPLGLGNWPPVQPNWPLIGAPSRRTSPLAENLSPQNIPPSTAIPSAEMAGPLELENWPPVQRSTPPMWAPVSSTPPETLKPSSSLRSPRVRSCRAYTAGTCDPVRRTDTAVASLRLIALAKEQSRRASGHRSVVASRLRSSVMRAPCRRTPRAFTETASPSPMRRSAITSARTVRSAPHSAHFSGESSSGLPTRRSTNIPVAAACQTLLSDIVRSLTFMANPTQPND